MPSNKKYYKPVKRYCPDDVDGEKIKELVQNGYRPSIFRNASGKPTKISFLKRSDGYEGEVIYDTTLYTGYALIKIEHLLNC